MRPHLSGSFSDFMEQRVPYLPGPSVKNTHFSVSISKLCAKPLKIQSVSVIEDNITLINTHESEY